MTPTERLTALALTILLAFILKSTVGDKIKTLTQVTSREIAAIGQ